MSRRRGRRRALLWAEATLLLVGFVAFGWWAWSVGSTAIDQSWSEYKFHAELRAERPSIRGYIAHLTDSRAAEERVSTAPRSDVHSDAPAESGVPAQPEERSRARRAEEPGEGRNQQRATERRSKFTVGETIGQLEIPRLKISGIVRHGMDDKTLKRAIGHLPGTPGPGEGGNMGLAAHRDTFFRNLKGVKEGDRILVKTRSGTYQYEVDSTKIGMPENVEVLDPTPDPVMTLVTCYPFNYIGNAPKRFIVRARQVDGDAVAQSNKATLVQAKTTPGE